MAQRSLRLKSHSWCCSPAIHACEKGPEPKDFVLLFSTTVIKAVPGPFKPSANTGEKAVPAIPSRQKPLHVLPCQARKVFPAAFAHTMPLLLNSWCCKSTPQDQPSYGHAATALLRRMPHPHCLIYPVKLLHAHTIPAFPFKDAGSTTPCPYTSIAFPLKGAGSPALSLYGH